MGLVIINPGNSGSGLGNHMRLVTLEFNGEVQQGDYVTVVLYDIRNAANVLTYQLAPASFAEINNTYQYIADKSPAIPNSSVYFPTDTNVAGLNIITPSYYTLQSAYVTLFNAGSSVFASVGALKGNSSYQVAFAAYDFWGRPFPLDTGYTYVVKTNSYAQAHGQTPAINWQIPAGFTFPSAVASFQVLISPNNTHERTLYTIASIISYQGIWDGSANSPMLFGGTTGGSAGYTVGQAFQVGKGGTQDLGAGAVTYLSGSYIIFNGTAWDNQPKESGDISNQNAYYFYLNSLELFNQRYNTSDLTYSFTPGDRCTLAYSQTPGVGNPITWYDGATHPLVDVEVLGYNQATNILKVNQSSAITPSSLQGMDVLIEIWTPLQRAQTDSAGATTLNETLFYEIGQYFPVTKGVPSTYSGTITQGDIYFQVVSFLSSQLPGSVSYNVLVENFNFSPFYASAYPNFGRSRTFNDTLVTTEQVANMPYSQTYIYGSQINGLTRFFAANIYGNTGGQTSSNYGRIRKMVQILLELLVIQELNHGTVPVYTNLVEDSQGNSSLLVSQVILGNFRYTEGLHIGMGNAKDSFAFYQNIAYWIDPHRSEPVRWAGNGAQIISGKMSKFFKQTLQSAYASGLKIIGWYDVFNNEYLISIQQPGGSVTTFQFTPAQWQFLAQYSVLPNQISITAGPYHSSAAYNNTTGMVTFTPPSGYVGTDTLQFSFPEGTKNACVQWTPGNSGVNAFNFISVNNQPLSTEIASNVIGINGNTIPAPISITGGQYSLNGAAFTSAPGYAAAGSTIQVQVLSSASNSTATSCTLSVGGQTSTFTATTVAAGVNAFNAFATYGMNIYSINNYTAASVPTAFNNVNLLNGSSLNEPYVSISPAGGQIHVTLTGSPAVPGHTYLGLSVGGVQQSDVFIPSAGTYPLTFTTSPSSPTAISVYLYTA